MSVEWLVETVDTHGVAQGTADGRRAHQHPGLLHRALSVMVVDGRGRMLTQKRSAGKSSFPSRWDVTCSGHPLPGQTPTEAAAVLAFEEVGLTAVVVEPAGCLLHRMRSRAGVEHVFQHVFLASMPRPVRVAVDPVEIDEVRWVGIADALTLAARHPRAFTPWFAKTVRSAVAVALLMG